MWMSGGENGELGDLEIGSEQGLSSPFAGGVQTGLPAMSDGRVPLIHIHQVVTPVVQVL